MWNLIFLFTGLIFIILLLIIFFSKETIATKENYFFKILIIVNAIEYLCEIPLQLIVRNFGVDNLIVDIFSKLYLISIFSWFSIFSIYSFMICLNKKDSKRYEKNYSIIKNVNILVWVVGSLLLFVLPIQKFFENDKMYAYGTSVDVLKLFLGLYMLVWFVLLVKNIKHITEKKYVPMFLVLVVLVLNVIIQSIDPSILIASMGATLICYTMSFTIENPDVKMMEELYKNRKIIERSNEDTSNFLFKITQDIRQPVGELIEVSSDSKDEKMMYVNQLSRKLDFLVEDALDVSSMTTKNLKLYHTRYSLERLLKEVEKKAELELPANVDLDFKYHARIPEYVYGDSIKVKQILYSVIKNAIDHTKEGTISLELNAIIKYGICRFIIDVRDNGKGIGIDKINEILSLKETEEKADLDKEILTLKEVKLLIQKLGGGFMVKSGEENGTIVTITLDQKIVETKESELSKKLDLYEESLHQDKKIMVVDDDPKVLNKIVDYLEEKGMTVSKSLYGKDCIERVNAKHKFDLILLDDETSTDSAYEVLKELQKKKNFHTPVVIMIRDHKESIRLHYLQDGFSDVIMKSKLKSELDRILKRFS